MADARTIIEVPERHCFEWWVDGHRAEVHYQRDGERWILDHVGVPPALEGQGIGTRLVAAVLSQIRATGGRVVPQCPFVARYFARHPAAADLLADD